MARIRLPFVQRRQLASGAIRFRGWAPRTGAHRWFGPWRLSEEAAYQDAMEARGVAGSVGVTLQAAIDAQIEECRAKRRPDTVRWYAGHLAAVTAKIPAGVALCLITRDQLEQFVRDRLAEWAVAPKVDADGNVTAPGRRVKPATVNADLRALHRVFALAIRRGEVDANPVRLIDRPRADRPAMDWFEASEMADLLSRVTDEEARDLFGMLALSGIRRSEAARLRDEHVRLQHAQLVVPGKTGTRTVPIADDLVPILRRLLVRAAGRGGHLFDGLGAIDRAFRDWQRKLAEPRLHAHALRHTFGTALVRAGVRHDVVMRLMGHGSITTTMRYVHEVGTDGMQAVRALRLLPGSSPAHQEPPGAHADA